MEIVKCFHKLTPEERRKELRKETFRQLKDMEMKRRERVAEEEADRRRKEKEDREKESERLERQKERNEGERRRQEVKQREEDVRTANELKTLEKFHLEQMKEWRLLMGKKEKISSPRLTQRDVKTEQQRREKDRCEISELKRKTLRNNWVGEQKTDWDTVKNPHPSESTHPPSTGKTSFKLGRFLRSSTFFSSEKPANLKSFKPLQWLQSLKSGLRSMNSPDQMEKKDTCRLRERYGNLEALRNRQQPQLSEQFGSMSMSRNRILKKCIP